MKDELYQLLQEIMNDAYDVEGNIKNIELALIALKLENILARHSLD